MRRRCQATNRKCFHVVAIVADRLNRVGMKESFVPFGQLADALNIEQVSDFVISVHERYQRTGIFAEEALKMVHIHVSLVVKLNIVQLDSSLFFQYLQRMYHGMVLNRSRDGVSQTVRLQATDDERIVGLGAP